MVKNLMFCDTRTEQMISNTAKSEFSINNFNGELTNHHEKKTIPEKPYRVQLVWKNIIILTYLHLGALYGLYLSFTSAKIATIIFMVILSHMSGFGVTAGVHRLWSHRAYKATWQLRLLLTLCNTIAFQDAVIDWSRDHRLHHKHSETNADPYNAKRGFFFAHVGWLLCRKHPDIKEKGKGIDLSDLYADPILRFQKKYYDILMPLCSFILPTVIPVYCWNESWTNAFYISAIFRWVYVINATWCVNSAAHLFGNKPYEKAIYPSQNSFVSSIALGEGCHNYHHTFPWDYKTAELGDYSFNFTTAFIDFFAWLGWAYDLKTVPEQVIKARVLRTGDGSHEVWGWGDKSATKAQLDATVITHQRS